MNNHHFKPKRIVQYSIAAIWHKTLSLGSSRNAATWLRHWQGQVGANRLTESAGYAFKYFQLNQTAKHKV